MKNWIEEFHDNPLQQKLKFIDEFKKRVYRQFDLSDTDTTEIERSERWAYTEKTFGVLEDVFNGDEYELNMDTGKIIKINI